LKSYHDKIVSTIHPDITYQNWLCDIVESIKDKDQHIAELICVEAYKSVNETLDLSVYFSDDRLKKCELVIEKWMNELDKEDLDPFYQLNKSKKTNEFLILQFLDKVDLLSPPDGEETNTEPAFTLSDVIKAAQGLDDIIFQKNMINQPPVKQIEAK
jgi:hypothetical protein